MAGPTVTHGEGDKKRGAPSGPEAIPQVCFHVAAAPRRALLPRGERTGVAPKPPPPDLHAGLGGRPSARCLVCRATEADVRSHVQVPLGLFFCWKRGALFLALNCRKCQPDPKTVVNLFFPIAGECLGETSFMSILSTEFSTPRSRILRGNFF